MAPETDHVNVAELSSRSHRLTITGRVNGQEHRFVYDDAEFSETTAENEFLPQLWATRRVGYLMEQIRLSGESRELREEIVELGTRYGIVTPYTSYLAVEPEAAAAVRGGADVRALPMSRPSANAGTGGGFSRDMAAPPPKEAAKATTGETAVRESRRARAQQEAVTIDGADEDDALRVKTGARKVGDKTFYLREAVWVDSEFKPEAKLPETALDFGSDEYFDLLKREPQLARFFSLGERVVVVYKGRVYRVNSKT